MSIPEATQRLLSNLDGTMGKSSQTVLLELIAFEIPKINQQKSKCNISTDGYVRNRGTKDRNTNATTEHTIVMLPTTV